MATKTNTKKRMKQPQSTIRVTLIYYGSLGCYADVFEDGSSNTASPGLGIPFITSFTVPET